MGILQKLRSRSSTEIRFRLRQEFSNIGLAAFPPRLPDTRPDPLPLPPPSEVASRLAGTPFANRCLQLAEEILRHRFPLMGITLETGPEIRWCRDYATGVEAPPLYFRRIPYLNVAKAGDHKTIWELNRHQHLVLLAQAHLFSGRQDFLDEIVRQLEGWLPQNPFQRSMNWTSALEVAFRALSWLWILHLAGDRFNPSFRSRFLEALYHHGRHLEVNLSYYFSPNTHLLGEAVALHALGALLPQFPQAKQWEETGARVVRAELDRQVLPDGCHFERSTYYHVYALDMFLFHSILRGDDVYHARLRQMAAFLASVLGEAGFLDCFGDDDGGRFFHPYGTRNRFGLATLATCGVLLDQPEWIRDERHLEEQAAWWLGTKALGTKAPHASHPPVSRQHASSGLVVMTTADVQLIADAGTFGPASGGHSHADTLSLVLRTGAGQILVDPGTYTYVADPLWRDRFRGTAAHNTIRIDGMDQGIPAGPFAWRSRPEVEVLAWNSSPSRDALVAACRYANFTHRRTIVFDKSDLWIAVIDRLEGPPGEHRIQQFWHFGAPVCETRPRWYHVGARALFSFDPAASARLSEGGDYGWLSTALGCKEPAPVVCVEISAAFPITLATSIDLSGKSRALTFDRDADLMGLG